MAAYLISSYWINVIAYGLAALILVIATRGRLGFTPETELARSHAVGHDQA